MGLGTPMIPKQITVHLGNPKAAARNVTVSWKDYIKNVASSEIYPTWPESALRANIYAITTFALNRIYTEFYRSQGYPFDITSSTAYDQAYVEGRDIFANISKIVDEQYNDYFVKRGQVQPMFSSYCNGTTARCSGLSQWGSYYLAAQGYTPYRILQYYYGDDVDLVFHAPEGNVQPSYTGRLYARGSEGEEVRTIQKMLRRIAQNFPAIPRAAVNTGVFDAQTDAAVRGFQKTFGLVTDGVVGKDTWNRMVSLYNSVKNLTELKSEGVSAQEAGRLYQEHLQTGDRGMDVRILQYYLNFISMFYQEMEPISPDGSFGAATKRAVQLFQQRYGLQPDGVVGRATYQNLVSAYQKLYQSLRPSDAQFFYPGYAFSIGESGEKIQVLQQMLQMVAQRVPEIPMVKADGIYGPVTAAAVTALQKATQLPVSGDADLLTWNTILELYEELLEQPNLRILDNLEEYVLGA